jgi:hypothetical protein
VISWFPKYCFFTFSLYRYNPVSAFRDAVLSGHWRDALAILTSLPISGGGGGDLGGQLTAFAASAAAAAAAAESPRDVRVIEATFLILAGLYTLNPV